MYQGNGHQFDNKFDNISDLMERYYNDGTPGARPGAEYRSTLRNMARLCPSGGASASAASTALRGGRQKNRSCP